MATIPGDPFGNVQEPKGPAGAPSAEEVNRFHSKSDKDSGVTAEHHTLGKMRNQAAPGNHNHSGIDSRKIGAGMKLSITGAKGGNAAVASIITMLAQVIEFTDNTTP